MFDGVRYILPPAAGGAPYTPSRTISTPGAGAVRRACPDSLRDPARQCAGRSPEPAAGSGGPRSHHAGGNVRGHKRTVAVDVGGTPVAVMVHAAGIRDRDGAPDVIAKPPVTVPEVRQLRAGGGHPGPKPRGRPDGTGPADITGTVEKPEDATGFTFTRHREVERTFAWMGRYRPLSKDRERLGDSPLASGVRHPAPSVRA